jgi:hypothetical protein
MKNLVIALALTPCAIPAPAQGSKFNVLFTGGAHLTDSNGSDGKPMIIAVNRIGGADFLL